MWWVDQIFSFVWDIADFFLTAYQEVSGWIWPFHYLQYPLYGLYQVCRSLLTPIAHFSDWTREVWTKILQVFSLEQITSFFRPWLDAAVNAWNWVVNSFWNVWNIVEDWWSSAQWTVRSWIAMATQGFNTLIVWWDEFWKITWPGWMATLEVLGDDVTHFFTHTLPDLLDYLKLENWWNGKLFAVDGLIGSRLVEWFPFYDDLVEIWNDVVEFFSDPGEFLLSRLTDWFLGKE